MHFINLFTILPILAGVARVNSQAAESCNPSRCFNSLMETEPESIDFCLRRLGLPRTINGIITSSVIISTTTSLTLTIPTTLTIQPPLIGGGGTSVETITPTLATTPATSSTVTSTSTLTTTVPILSVSTDLTTTSTSTIGSISVTVTTATTSTVTSTSMLLAKKDGIDAFSEILLAKRQGMNTFSPSVFESCTWAELPAVCNCLLGFENVQTVVTRSGTTVRTFTSTSTQTVSVLTPVATASTGDCTTRYRTGGPVPDNTVVQEINYAVTESQCCAACKNKQGCVASRFGTDLNFSELDDSAFRIPVPTPVKCVHLVVESQVFAGPRTNTCLRGFVNYPFMQDNGGNVFQGPCGV